MSHQRSFASRRNLGKFITTSRHDTAARGLLIVLTVALGLLYVLQMNVTATKGYDIRELEQQKESLQKESRQLQLQAVELQSVERIMAQLPQHRLVEARPDTFLSTATTTFAAR